jgi:hypothetical protein
MAIRFPKSTPSKTPLQGGVDRTQDLQDKGVVKPGDDDNTPPVAQPKLQHNEASADVRAVVGDTGTRGGKRKKSAGSRGALAGMQQAAGDEKAKGKTPRWKKVVLGAMLGITVLNAAAPLANAQTVTPPDNPVKMEQVVQTESYANPLMAQLAAKGVTLDGDLEKSAPTGDGVNAGFAQQHVDDDGGARGLDLRLNVDDVELDGATTRTLSPEVQQVVDRATERFNDRVDDILNRDAKSLARGETMWQPGDDLSEKQSDQLKDALTDMFKDLPAGALSESLTGPLKTLLDNNGVDTTNFETTKLGDLGDYGSDLAKNLVDQFKDKHPVGFYATAGVLAAGVATYGYLEGSEALRDLGIKPELSTDLFNDKLEVKVSADWERNFTELVGTVDGTYKLVDHRVGAGVNFDGDDFNPRLSYSFDGEKWDAKVEGQYNTGDGSVDANGFVNYRPNSDLNLRLSGVADSDGDDHLRFDVRKTLDNDSTLDLGVRHVWDDKGDDFTDVNARWRLSRDDFNIDATAGYRFGENDGFRAGLGVGYEPADNMELQLRGDINQHGDASVGVGFTWRF